MDLKDVDFKNITAKEHERIDKIKEHLMKRGNFAETVQEELALRKKLSINVCPCDVCNSVMATKEAGGILQMRVVKLDENKYMLAPVKHMSNEEFIASSLWSYTGRTALRIISQLRAQGVKITGYDLHLDDTKGNNWNEHGNVILTVYK
jgi:hypothetical protein